MLTPVEIQGKSFRSGIGYDKKDVDHYIKEIITNYELLYKENVEVKDKMNILSEGLQYYKSIEKTLQKALVLAEQTAEKTEKNAMEKAKIIEDQAHIRADLLIADAKHDLDRIHMQTIALVQEYEKYKAMLKQFANTQIELLNNDAFNINLSNLDAFISVHQPNEPSTDNCTSAQEEQNLTDVLTSSVQTAENLKQSISPNTANENADQSISQDVANENVVPVPEKQVEDDAFEFISYTS